MNEKAGKEARGRGVQQEREGEAQLGWKKSIRRHTISMTQRNVDGTGVWMCLE